MNRVLILLPFLLLPACGGDTPPLSVAGYGKFCATDAECAAVTTGEICGVCSCANDAINRADLTRYQAALKEKIDSCSEPPVACPCQAPQVVCTQGACVLQ